ncbi:MAG TPA: hypothetical protein VEG39_17515 [Clostridia bacterium]|nr:hypothetical protein [Clostridia bacterium]
MNAVEYKKSLIIMLSLTEKIYNNTLYQCQALKSNNLELLGSLLKEQQENINKLPEYKGSHQLTACHAEDAEIESIEENINLMLDIIIKTIISNISIAKKQKDEIGSSICLLKVNRNTIRNGYFKKSSQQYGYFIDKKIGR